MVWQVLVSGSNSPNANPSTLFFLFVKAALKSFFRAFSLISIVELINFFRLQLKIYLRKIIYEFINCFIWIGNTNRSGCAHTSTRLSLEVHGTNSTGKGSLLYLRL